MERKGESPGVMDGLGLMDLVQGRRELQIGAAVRAAGDAGAGVMIKVIPANGRSLQDGRPAARPPFPFHSPTPAYYPQ